MNKKWIDNSPKIYRCQINIWKDTHHLILAKCKLKTQGFITIYIRLATKQTKKQKHDNTKCYGDAEHLKLLYLAVGNVKWSSYLRKQHGSFLQSQTYTYHVWPSNLTLGYLPEWNENLCSHKHLHMNITHLIYNLPKTSNNLNVPHLGMNKLWFTHTMENYSAIKKNKTTNTPQQGWIPKAPG